MKKYIYRPLLLVLGALFVYTVSFAQAPICPQLTPGPGAALPCGVTCTTLTATMNTTLNATTSYSVSATTYAPYSYTAGTAPTASGGYTDDWFGNVITLPFNFCFFGSSYSQIVIGSNGNICFSTSVANTFDPYSVTGPLPGSNCAATKNCIMTPWQDLDPVISGTMRYATYGTAPCRKFVVSWSAAMFSTSYCTYTSNTQLVLYESNNIIDIYIGNVAPCGTWNSGRAVTGIENAAGTLFYTAPGENGVSFSATNQGWRFTPTGAASPWTYTWTGPGGYSAVGSTVTACPPTGAGSSSYVYTVTATTTACSTLSYSATVSVSTNGSLGPLFGDTLMCTGDTATYHDTTVGGIWTSSNTAVATVSPTGFVTGVGGGTATISYDIGAGCVGTKVVTVYPTPSVIGGPGSLCQPNSVTLTNTAPGGNWVSSDPSVASIGVSTGVVTGVAGGTAIIEYSTGPHLCVVTRTFTVNATAPITGTTDMCQYFTTTLADAVAGGTWSSGAPTIATVNAAGVVTGVGGGTATIAYTTGAGCVMTKIVTVHPKPSAPTQLPPTSYCQFSIPVPVSASGSSLTWYGPGVTAGYTVSPTPSTATPGITGYYVTQTSAFGCTSDSGIVTITVIAKPAPPIVSDTTYCQDFGNPAPLSAIGPNIHWYNQSGTPISGTPTPSTATIGTTTYYADQTVNGCTSDQVPLTITVIFKPDFNIRYSDNKVCQFDTLRFSYDGPVMVGPGYHWDIPYGATLISGNIYDTTITVRFDSASGPQVVYLTASDLNGMCSTVKSLNIKVIAQPGAHGSIRPDICLGDTILLALSNRSDNASQFAWTVDGQPLTSTSLVNIITASSNTGGPFLVTFNTSGRHIVMVTGSAEGMCASKPATDSINVHGLPDAAFKVKNIQSKFCIEDSVEFVADTIVENYSYAWAPAHSFSNVNKADVWGKAEQERSIISLTVTDPFGCKSMYSMELDPETCCQVVMPSAFSPNGDSKNDTYKPIFNGFHRFHMFRITNRWGQTIYECTNSDPHWDGTYNGVPQDIGVFFYYIKFDCGGKTIEQKGDVTLVR